MDDLILEYKDMKTRNMIFAALVGGSLSLSSCTDFLDVSDELASNLTMEQVFDNVAYTKGWHANIYNCISEYSGMFFSINAMNNPWPYLCNELTVAFGAAQTEMVNGFTPTQNSFNRFSMLYPYIRQAHIFLDRAKPLGDVNDQQNLTEEDIARMKSEAKFFIAYSYFSLFELNGPVPIVREALAPDLGVYNYPRATVDEMVQYIDSTLQVVLDEDVLPHTLRYVDENTGEEKENMNEMVRPTRAVVLALRAKLWVYAASKLFNGGFPEAVELRDPLDRQLFPPEDRNKWKIARQRVKEFIDFAEANGYELFRVYNKDGSENPSQSVYQVFQNYNREIIWATSKTYMNAFETADGLDKRCTPMDIFNSFGGIGVSQQSVDAFFTDKGLDIHEDPDYDETGFSDVENPCAQKKPQIDKHVFNMYAHREPRFYHAVTYQGKSWHLQPRAGYTVRMAKGEPNENGKLSTREHYSGYYLYKRVNQEILNTGSYKRSWARPSIIFRLADFYLYYAEACNEVDPSDPNIIKYLDLVRDRAGIPGYQELRDKGVVDSEGKVIKVDIIGDYEKQAKAIRRERQVELFSEGQRYFDVRRWMICGPGEEADQSVEYGMNVNGYSNIEPGKPNSFFTRVVARTYNWKRAMYLYPIPHNEIEKSPSMVQNPLWYE